jgi:glycosyltransferase involved in cell wall biosynthesis
MKNTLLISLLLVSNYLSLNAYTVLSSSSDKPKVSIITSLYKGGEFIAGFLSDIVRQSIFDQCELIIINANSPDNEEPLIREYMKQFPNIIYRKLDNDPGLYAVWNMAIKIARGDLITNANVDDRRDPESLENQVRALEQDPSIDLVYSDFYVTHHPNETFECNSHTQILSPDEFSPTLMYKCLPGPQPMWRKEIHRKYGYFDETFISGGDFEMWNRASSQGSVFKKIPGFSGVFYLNPKGLSTDNDKRDIQESELQRVNNKYRSMWVLPENAILANYAPHFFCTAADSPFFKNLINLIGSIHETSYDALGEIAVFDLGMTDDELALLSKIEKVSVHKIEAINPDLLKLVRTSNSGKHVPGWYAWKFVILKQALDIYPYVLWVDAGTTILKPLDALFKYIQQEGYFLATIGDEKVNDRILHPISWGATEYVKTQFNLTSPQKSYILHKEPLLSGTIGVSRKALEYLVNPLYAYTMHLRLFEDDGTTPNGFGTGRHDQTVLSVFAYLHGLTIHHQDHMQKTPIYLQVDEKYEEFYVTWNGAYVNEKTCLYNSRGDLRAFDHYYQAIRYKKERMI